jgi:hypothetical protein
LRRVSSSRKGGDDRCWIREESSNEVYGKCPSGNNSTTKEAFHKSVQGYHYFSRHYSSPSSSDAPSILLKVVGCDEFLLSLWSLVSIERTDTTGWLAIANTEVSKVELIGLSLFLVNKLESNTSRASLILVVDAGQNLKLLLVYEAFGDLDPGTFGSVSLEESESMGRFLSETDIFTECKVFLLQIQFLADIHSKGGDHWSTGEEGEEGKEADTRVDRHGERVWLGGVCWEWSGGEGKVRREIWKSGRIKRWSRMGKKGEKFYEKGPGFIAKTAASSLAASAPLLLSMPPFFLLLYLYTGNARIMERCRTFTADMRGWLHKPAFGIEDRFFLKEDWIQQRRPSAWPHS